MPTKEDISKYLKESFTARNAVGWGTFYAFFPLSIVFSDFSKKAEPDEVKNKGRFSALKMVASQIPLGRMLTASLIVISVNQIFQQVSGLGFESADDYLKSQGYSKKNC